VKLESNIQGVIDRLKRKPRDIRAAMARTLAPAEWDFVKTFIETIMVAPFMTGFFARMTNPLPPVLAIDDFMMAQGLQMHALRTEGPGKGATLFSQFLNQFDEMMADWVASEKHKDKRDADKTDEEIGHFIGYLMLTPDSQLSDKEKAAKVKLMPHIADYIQRKQADKRLPNDTINAWLLAVLAAWSALVRREFPGRLQTHLAAVRTEL
jgi:hypothetical protein